MGELESFMVFLGVFTLYEENRIRDVQEWEKTLENEHF